MWMFALIGLAIFFPARLICRVNPENAYISQYVWLAYTLALVFIMYWWTRHVKKQIEGVRENRVPVDFPLGVSQFRTVDDSLKRLAKTLEAKDMDRWYQKARQADENLSLIVENSVDPLTGVANRRALEKHLSKTINKEEPVSLVMLDIDHFKKVNDTYGHLVGDEVLRHVAGTVQKAIRPGDFLARYGGEEFTIILCAGMDSAALVAERVRQAIESSRAVTSAGPVKITSSLGVAEYRRGETGKSLKERADAALYKAKQSGRNRVVKGDD